MEIVPVTSHIQDQDQGSSGSGKFTGNGGATAETTETARDGSEIPVSGLFGAVASETAAHEAHGAVVEGTEVEAPTVLPWQTGAGRVSPQLGGGLSVRHRLSQASTVGVFWVHFGSDIRIIGISGCRGQPSNSLAMPAGRATLTLGGSGCWGISDYKLGAAEK